MGKAYTQSAMLKIEMDMVGHRLPLIIDIEISHELARVIKENKCTNARFIVAEKSTFPQLIIPQSASGQILKGFE